MSATNDFPPDESLNIMSGPLTDEDEKGTKARSYPQPCTWNSMLRDMSAYIRLLEEQENRMARLPAGLGDEDLALFKTHWNKEMRGVKEVCCDWTAMLLW